MDSSNSDNSAGLFKSIINNFVLRKKIQTNYTEENLFSKGDIFKYTDEINLQELLETKNQQLVLEKLIAFKNVLENKSVSSGRDDNSVASEYSDWLDFDVKGFDLVGVKVDQPQDQYALIKEINSVLVGRDRLAFYNLVLRNLGLGPLVEIVQKISLKDVESNVWNDETKEYTIGMDHLHSVYKQTDLDYYNSLEGGEVFVLNHLLFPSPSTNQIDKESLMKLYNNYGDVQPFYQNKNGMTSICMIKEVFPEALEYFENNRGSVNYLIIDDYDCAVLLMEKLKPLKDENMYVSINILGEDIRIAEVLEDLGMKFVYYFSLKLVADEKNITILLEKQPYVFRIAQLIGNPYIKDIFGFVEKLYQATSESKKKSFISTLKYFYQLAVCMGKLEFVEKYTPEIPQIPSFVEQNIILAYSHGQDEMLAFMKSLQVPPAEFVTNTKMLIAAVDKVDLPLIKKLYAALDHNSKLFCQKDSINSLLVSLHNCRTPEEKVVVHQALQVFRDLKQIGDPAFNWPLFYLQEKDFCLELWKLANPNRKKEDILPFLIKGTFTKSVAYLRYILDHLSPQELEFVEKNILSCIGEYLSFDQPHVSLKCILYLFTRFQSILGNIATLDQIMTIAIKTDNHRLIDVLLHRTKVRLIDSPDKDQQQQILERMESVLVSSKHQSKTTYFKNHAEIKDAKSINQESIQELDGISNELHSYSFDFILHKRKSQFSHHIEQINERENK
ncbi:hypothetical protein CYY_009196 [Polysphondylium violaceum]|uniref:Uncharacterized protein n=1 Tax=Polysphondylium violaceum TaxID=133409 RepID=A0A8J4PN74_9MYCE|nr:hypothetical protein CYY_009196 [Polysphondylium violaceum]